MLTQTDKAAPTVRCYMTQSAPIRVRCYAKFYATFQGERHQFAVADCPDGTVGQQLMHVASGYRVKLLGVGAVYLPRFAKLRGDSFKARGLLVLEELVKLHGEAVLRSKFASVPDLPKEKAAP